MLATCCYNMLRLHNRWEQKAIRQETTTMLAALFVYEWKAHKQRVINVCARAKTISSSNNNLPACDHGPSERANSVLQREWVCKVERVCRSERERERERASRTSQSVSQDNSRQQATGSNSLVSIQSTFWPKRVCLELASAHEPSVSLPPLFTLSLSACVFVCVLVWVAC